MRKSVSFTLYARQQPNETARIKAKELVEMWNLKHAPKWLMRGAGEYSIYSIAFDDTTSPHFGELERELDEYQEQYHISIKRRVNKTYEEEDYEQADMVLLYGYEVDGYVADRSTSDDEHKSFVMNLSDNWIAGNKCPSCGWINPSYGQQRGPFVIDEFFLDREYDDDSGAWKQVEHGWDMLSLPGDVILISDRVLKAFQDQSVQGYHILEVLSKDTGKASQRMFQLLPDHWVAGLCEVHSEIIGGVCPACGRVLGEMRGETYLWKEWIGNDEVIGRHPGPRLIYYAQRVYQLLVAIQAKGMIRSVPLYLCDHRN